MQKEYLTSFNKISNNINNIYFKGINISFEINIIGNSGENISESLFENFEEEIYNKYDDDYEWREKYIHFCELAKDADITERNL